VSRDQNIHTIPTEGRIHVETGYSCWCNPTVEMICPQCGDDDKQGCWRCAGRGWVDCDDPERYDGAVGLLVIHNI
jgi:hypothetical protein